jgi:hypothetical protein
MSSSLTRLSVEELQAETGALLPAKEVLSVPLLDLNVDVDLALALAAPIDLAVAANANAALPIDAAVSANVLSALSTAAAAANQGALIDQVISGQAIAEGDQTAAIHQPDTSVSDGGGGAGESGTTTGDPGGTETADASSIPPPVTAETDVVQPLQDEVGTVLESGLLNVDVNVALDADLAAPIAGAVAANANVAAPIDAAVAANVGAIGSEAVAVADQTAIISQQLNEVTAQATAEQNAEIDQQDTETSP